MTPVQNGDQFENLGEVDGQVPLDLGMQVRVMMRAVAAAANRRMLAALALGIFTVVAATAYGQILLNAWNQPFYDALAHLDLHGFLVQLGVFFAIAGGLLVLNVVQRWLVEMLKLKLRECVVRDLLQAWMPPRRAFHLASAGQIGINPDQRMHEDARKLCELTADLGTGLLQATILFVTFASVLWGLSEGFALRLSGRPLHVPGFLLWAAVGYAALGSLLSYTVGRGLVSRNAVRYGREANLRASLIWINEHVDGIALSGGEANEQRRVERDLGDVLLATRRLVTGLTNLTWVTAGFGWVTIVAPVLFAAPLFFDGRISFGGLMMAASAFTQAQSSLRWFVDNFSAVADWRASLLRVAKLRQALLGRVEAAPAETRIVETAGAPGRVRFVQFVVAHEGGSDRLLEEELVVQAGERVLLACAPGTSKASFVRAFTGLWSRGSGCIERERSESVHCVLLAGAYLPRGTLREVLAYPQRVDAYDGAAYGEALRRMGLAELVPVLDETQRWDRALGQSERIRVALARALVQRPRWLLLDDVLGALDTGAVARLGEALARELAATGLIYLGRETESHMPIFTRVAHWVGADAAAAARDARPVTEEA